MFNILIDSSSLNILLSLLPHLSKIREGTNVLLKMHGILGFLNFALNAIIFFVYTLCY